MREKLPKKWCVKADSTKIVQKFFLTMPNASNDYIRHVDYNNKYFHSKLETSGPHSRAYSSNIIREGFEEITIQEFKKLVLGIIENDRIPEFLN